MELTAKMERYMDRRIAEIRERLPEPERVRFLLAGNIPMDTTPGLYEFVIRPRRKILMEWPYYLYVRQGDRLARDRWTFECAENNFPFVIIQERSKYYAVEWDDLTTAADIQERLRARHDELAQRIEEILVSTIDGSGRREVTEKILRRALFDYTGPVYSKLERLDYSTAKIIAQKVFETIWKFTRQTPEENTI